jgi:protein-disulfide isomerase
MIRATILGVSAAAALMLTMPSAQAATLAECAAQWRELKDNGQQGDQTYREFSSKCMKADNAAAEEPAPAKKKAAEDKPKKAKQVVEIEDQSDGNNGSGALKKECDAKWKVNKASTGATGWKAYFTFMARCM